METDRSWGKLSKILCIRLDSLGDVLMTTPALRALKETNPCQHNYLVDLTSRRRSRPVYP
jgi:hypothetical protein